MLVQLRNSLFWLIDLITGGNKRSHYKNVKFLMEFAHTKKALDQKKFNLNAILQHTIDTVPFYQKLDLTPTLNQFPVVNKNDIRNRFDDFQSFTYLEKNNRLVSTSGSTGTPFQIYQDNNKCTRNIADNLYFWKKAGYRLGQKLFYFRLWNAFQKKGKLVRFIQNIVPVDVFDLSEEYMNTLLDKSQQNHSQIGWLGYASAFEKICKHLDTVNPDFRSKSIGSIIAISEKLNEYTKTSVHKYFGTEVLSRYSNVENGIIAQQPYGASYFLINQASYYVEILQLERNIPIPNGEIGRIVITDLFNYSTPMVRYDTGDLGAIDYIDNKLVFTRIEGRKIDVIRNTKGELISFNLVLIINKYPELEQCQLIQKEKKRYILKINTKNHFDREEDLLNEFKEYLGNDAILITEYVNEIPLLASGKRRVMVNEMV